LTGRASVIVSEKDTAILDFVREYLPAMRKGEIYDQLTGRDSVMVACVLAEGGRVQALSLLPRKVQHEHKWGRLLQWLRVRACYLFALLRVALRTSMSSVSGRSDTSQSTKDVP
jgi:hypothetical protein